MMNQHAPFYHYHKGSTTAVLFVHGLLASPIQFERTVSTIYAKGYSVMAILLPGHGGDVRSFSKASLSDWHGEVSKAVLALSKAHEKVILVGHSLGALLILEQSAKQRADGLILLSPALKVKISLNTIGMSVRLLFRNPKKDNDWIRFCRRIYSVAPCRFYEYIYFLPPMLNVLKLSRHVQKNLRQNPTPALVIHSKSDETVRMKSVKLLRQSMPNIKGTLILNHSKHDYIAADEQKKYHEAILAFIERISAGEPYR